MTEWIIPYNENGEDAFRVNDALHERDKIEWVQNTNLKKIQVGDTAYLYQAAPVKAIRWKCEVTDVQRAISRIDDSKFSGSGKIYPGPFIELKWMREYFLPQLLSLDKLRQNGYRGNMQGSCRLRRFESKLSDFIHGIDKIYASPEKLVKAIQNLPPEELERSIRNIPTEELERFIWNIPIDELAKLAERTSNQQPKVSETKAKRYKRDPVVSGYAKRRAGKCCELCKEKAPFLNKAGRPYLEVHHIIWLSKGGADSIENTVALCPNCHRKMHEVQDPKDILLLQKIPKR